MGELLKEINRVDGIRVEINKGNSEGGLRNIHVQNEHFRFCVSEKDFIEMAVSIKKAIKVLKHNKGIE